VRRRAAQGGYTLLEVLAVAAIAVGLIAVAGVGVRRLRQSDLRTASTRLAGALKFAYDRAVTSGRYYRLVIDLDQKTYWPEVSDDRFYLSRGRGATGATEEENQPEGAAAALRGGGRGGSLLGLLGGTAGAPAGPPAKVGAAKARFTAAPTDKQRRAAPLRGITITAVWTPRFEEAVTQGRAYLYFYPEGMTERTIIHLEDSSENAYSLVMHPLTGRVEIFNHKVDIPREGDVDDAGEARQ